MKLDVRLQEIFADKARLVTVELLCLGLGYTAVTTSDGGIGLSYTYFDRKSVCSVVDDYHDAEGRPASELLEKIRSTDTIEKSMALALVNALNYENTLSLPEDRDNTLVFEKLQVREGTRVAMVGFFGPLVKVLDKRKALLEVIDDLRGIGSKPSFYQKLSGWADALILTSTSILNDTTEEILGHVSPGVKTVLMGPSTPMVADAFTHLPVHVLAGTVPVEKEQVLKAVRHGLGTRYIQKYSKKSFRVC
ncbi:MAG: DUF364 domain-containing protein [Desulfobacterales bacterium]|jgi:uncharacterized protein (DUF4213/DUF364 family)